MRLLIPTAILLLISATLPDVQSWPKSFAYHRTMTSAKSLLKGRLHRGFLEQAGLGDEIDCTYGLPGCGFVGDNFVYDYDDGYAAAIAGCEVPGDFGCRPGCQCDGCVNGPCNHGPCAHAPCDHGPCDHGPCGHGPCDHGPCGHGPCNSEPCGGGRKLLAVQGSITANGHLGDLLLGAKKGCESVVMKVGDNQDLGQKVAATGLSALINVVKGGMRLVSSLVKPTEVDVVHECDDELDSDEVEE